PEQPPALMASLEKPPRHVRTHSSQTNHADLHSVFLLRNRFEDLHEPFDLTALLSGHCLIRGCSKTFHGCDDSFPLTKNRRPGDQHVGSCSDYQWRSRRVDAAINLEVAARSDLIDHLADTANLGQRRVDERLMAKARVDRHDYHLIHVLEDFFEHCRWGGRIDDYADA